MKVEKFLKAFGTPVFTVRPGDRLAETARSFGTLTGRRRYSLAVVCDDQDRVVGIVSLGDLAHAMGEHKERAAAMQVQDVMTREVISCRLDDDVEEALAIMARSNIRHMPVVEESRLVGLMARRDALEFLYEEAALDIKQLREYVFRSGARY